MAEYRQLTSEEIQRLELNGCRCSKWSSIRVSDKFNPDKYVRVNFSGEIFLGSTDESVIGYSGTPQDSGISDSSICNCTIGNNVRISHVSNLLANYIIEDGCYISNIGTLTTGAGAGFGNGTRVNVLNETGGRTNIIYDRLSAQIAYLMTFYRHDAGFIRSLTDIIESYVESKRSDFGRIGCNSVILNCGELIDLCVHPGAIINGASRLIDGTVGERAKIGSGVIAEHFIVQSQATVDNASILINSLVGQAARLSNCFVAHDSMFFANCAMECGEAVATFAGPHTVSMHKSSLLIGGYFSFFNAGSGTNESNHLYKLGPIHQGVVERGCKTASNTYIMWPARFGAFTLVSGAHYSHPDTSALPYSYAMSREGRTYVIPGANLKTMGTIRDLLKWGERDKRDKSIECYDIINYDNLSPMTTNGMYSAISFLNKYETRVKSDEDTSFDIEPCAVRKGREYYAIGVEYFMGEAFVQHLLSISPNGKSSLKDQLTVVKEKSYSKWIDLAGLIAPADLVNEICAKVADSTITTLSGIESALHDISDRYYALKWSYVLANLGKCYSVAPDDLSPEIALSIIDRWRDAVNALDRLRKEDAMKDYSEPMTTGFGIDGDRQCRIDDFKAVNGNPEEHEIIVKVHKHYADALLDAHEITSRIKKTFAITD
ncbi:MAG: DUF4954 family protein [Muribaculum sp.]|nr:DUF4954 family protein [Muribaculum sp.]